MRAARACAAIDDVLHRRSFPSAEGQRRDLRRCATPFVSKKSNLKLNLWAATGLDKSNGTRVYVGR